MWLAAVAFSTRLQPKPGCRKERGRFGTTVAAASCGSGCASSGSHVTGSGRLAWGLALPGGKHLAPDLLARAGCTTVSGNAIDSHPSTTPASMATAMGFADRGVSRSSERGRERSPNRQFSLPVRLWNAPSEERPKMDQSRPIPTCVLDFSYQIGTNSLGWNHVMLSTPDQSTIKALIKATRAFVDSLEAELRLGDGGATQEPGPTAPTAAIRTHGAVTFDPLTDEPPFKPDPVGTPEEQWMAWLTYIGAIYAINKREDRGATRGEVVRYAKKAGYGDARGVSGFSNGRGTTYSAEDGTRWVTDKSNVRSGWLRELQDQLGIDLPDDLSDGN